MLSKTLRFARGNKRRRKDAIEGNAQPDESFDNCIISSEGEAVGSGEGEAGPSRSVQPTPSKQRDAHFHGTSSAGGCKVVTLFEPPTPDDTIGAVEYGFERDRRDRGNISAGDGDASSGCESYASCPPSPNSAAYEAYTGRLLERLNTQERDYNKLMTYYRDLYGRFNDAKGEIAQLRSQVHTLKAQVQRRDDRLNALKHAHSNKQHKKDE